MKYWGLVVLLVLAAAGMIFTPGSAQEATPEPTPTPSPTLTPTPNYWHSATTSTGGTVLIRNEVTTGDIGITVAVLILAAVELVAKFVTIPQLFMKR